MKMFIVKHPIITLLIVAGVCKTVSDTVVTVTKLIKSSECPKTITINISDDSEDSKEGEKNKEN